MFEIYATKTENNKKSRHDNAYLILKYALNVDFLDIKKTPSGKPYINGHDNVYFNISHSNEYAVCAVADIPVGIDIEFIRPLSERFTKRYLNGCSPEEAIREWTRRESFGKLTGEGFANTSDEPHVFREYDDIPGYIVMVCVFRNGIPVIEPPRQCSALPPLQRGEWDCGENSPPWRGTPEGRGVVSRPDGLISPYPEFPEKITWYQK